MSKQSPLLSVVVVIVSDTTSSQRTAKYLGRCLDALSHQVDAPPTEIIVPYLPPVDGLDQVKREYPQVNFIPVDLPQSPHAAVGNREHHDQLRARGLVHASGDIIGLLEDHAIPDPKWCAAVVAANAEIDFAAVGGAIENDIDRALNWAVYYCDFGKYQNPVLAGESSFASDANIAYKRAALESIRPVWQDVFRETLVNWALSQRGGKIALSPDMIVYQHRSDLRLDDAVRERFVWGSSYATSRAQMITGTKRMMYAVLSPLLPLVLVSRMTANAVRKKRNLRAFFGALPLTTLLTIGWACGEFVGDLKPRLGKSAVNAPQADIRA